MSSNGSNSIDNYDLSFLQTIEPYYSEFIYVLFVFKAVLFIFLFYMLNKVHAKVLQGYRFYLSFNVTTTYAFGQAFVLWQPIIMLPDAILCGVGPTKNLGRLIKEEALSFRGVCFFFAFGSSRRGVHLSFGGDIVLCDVSVCARRNQLDDEDLQQ